MSEYFAWIFLVSYSIILLALDIFVFNRNDTPKSVKHAMRETVFFVLNGLLFSGFVYYFYQNNLIFNENNLSPDHALVKYITGYLIELSLSIDNLFVIAVIFTSFKIPQKYQHKLLFYGILGALVFRAILIGVGLVLIHKIEGMTIFFGLFLLFTALKMLKKEKEHDVIEEPKGISKFLRISKELDGGKFITTKNGKRVLTGLFGALITIEFTDLLFALDSIPAIFAVTTDPFIVYSSNIFAIMGLRSLYFFLANMLEKFAYLKYSVFAILVFVSIKLITAMWVDIPEWFSLLYIGICIAIGIYVSILNVPKEKL